MESFMKCKKCNTLYQFEQMVDRVEKFCLCDVDGSDIESIYADKGYFQ